MMFHDVPLRKLWVDQNGPEGPIAPSIKKQQARLPAATAGGHRGAVADHIDLQLPRMATWPAAEVWMGFSHEIHHAMVGFQLAMGVSSSP